jgi:DNA repair protein RecN (Recombination protein N)
MREDEDFLRHAVAEFDALDPQEGEDEQLDAQRRLMQGAERMRAEIAKAQTALGHEGAEGAANDALRWLEGAAETAGGHLDAPIAALGRALVELDEATTGMAQALDQLAFNATDLEETEERLFALRALARKHSIAPDHLPGFGNELKVRLATLDQGEGDIADLRSALATADAQYAKAAEALSKARQKAALALDKAMMQELAPLKMERAVFETVITSADPGPEGVDEVTFCVATNPGAPSGALNKIASGGELSRFLLALKVCLTGTETGVTLIFDEIDRGVGGATADAVGRRLAQLASGGQVLVVTHSPQVAAQAGHHWRVEKHVNKGQTLSSVVSLPRAERVDEIARMLSGDTITDEARAAARKLMAG